MAHVIIFLKNNQDNYFPPEKYEIQCIFTITECSLALNLKIWLQSENKFFTAS